jgi:hypothetical protein
MKHTLAAALLVLLPLTTPAAADSPPVADSGAVLAAMRQASGGEHWTQVRTLHFVSRVSYGGVTASGERWEDVAAGRYLTRTVWPTYTSLEGFDGVTPWLQGRSGIAYTLGDVDARLVAADEAFRVVRGWWFPERHAATIAFAGERAEGARRFVVLEVTPEGGRAFRAWIDATTHLLARTEEQQAEDQVVIEYSDYRAVGGVLLPFTIRRREGADPAFDQVATVERVDINTPVADELYSVAPRPPADIVLPAGQNSVTVAMRLTADNRILVPVTIGARTLQAELDSGGNLLLQPTSVAALNLPTTGRTRVTGGGEGSASASDGRLAQLALGAAQVRGLSFHSYAFRPGQPELMLLGLEFFQRFVVRLDFDRGLMTLTRPESFSYHGSGAIVPFHFQDNEPEIKGSIDGIAGLFIVDTGDTSSLLLIAPFARRYDLVARYHADVPYTGTAVSATHGVWARRRVHTVAFDGPDGRALISTHDPVTRISLQSSGFDANRNVSANIGLGLLQQFNLTFDYLRQRIILEPNRRYGQKDVFNRTGLRLKRDGDQWSVTGVYPGSAAEAAGLKVGERVSRIDGETPVTLDTEGLARKTKGPIGSRMQVQVGPAGKERLVVLRLADFL